MCAEGRHEKSTCVSPLCFTPSKPACRVTRFNFGEERSSMELLFGSLELKRVFTVI